MKAQYKIIKIEDHIDSEFGERGTKKREAFEQGYEAFKLGAMLQEMRKEKNMTQEQLAEKCGTTKTNISKIENNSGDIKLSTLMQVVQRGLGVHLTLSLQL